MKLSWNKCIRTLVFSENQKEKADFEYVRLEK
jgi:chorismate mutase